MHSIIFNQVWALLCLASANKDDMVIIRGGSEFCEFDDIINFFKR